MIWPEDRVKVRPFWTNPAAIFHPFQMMFWLCSTAPRVTFSNLFRSCLDCPIATTLDSEPHFSRYSGLRKWGIYAQEDWVGRLNDISYQDTHWTHIPPANPACVASWCVRNAGNVRSGTPLFDCLIPKHYITTQFVQLRSWVTNNKPHVFFYCPLIKLTFLGGF